MNDLSRKHNDLRSAFVECVVNIQLYFKEIFTRKSFGIKNLKPPKKIYSNLNQCKSILSEMNLKLTKLKLFETICILLQIDDVMKTSHADRNLSKNFHHYHFFVSLSRRREIFFYYRNYTLDFFTTTPQLNRFSFHSIPK